MANKAIRKPVGNFFIKKSLQLRFIIKVGSAALLSALLSAGSLLLVYYTKYGTALVYMLDVDNRLVKEHIVQLILPTLVISSLVGLLAAFGIGLYASRKYAVPIFKIEQWISTLLNGKITAVLRFREKEEMKELTKKCNELGAFFCGTLHEIKEKVKAIQDAGIKNEDLDAIAKKLDAMELSKDSGAN